MRFLSLILVSISTFLFPLFSVSAAGLSVSPSSFTEAVASGDTLSRMMTVSNPTSEVALIEVFPDDFDTFISMDPRSFTLEAGESRRVRVDMRGEREGVYSTFVSVVARPLGQRQIAAGSGIKIPLTMHVSSESSSWLPWWVWVIAGVDVVLLGVFLHTRRKRKKRFGLF